MQNFKLHTYFESWIINTSVWLQVKFEVVYPLVLASYIQAIKKFVKGGDKLLCLFSTWIAKVSKQICYRFAQYLNKSVSTMKCDVMCVVCVRTYEGVSTCMHES